MYEHNLTCIQRLDQDNVKIVLKQIKVALIYSFGDMHELVLLGMPCDSELMENMGFIRDWRTRRRLLRPRVINMLTRFKNDPNIMGVIHNVLQSTR